MKLSLRLPPSINHLYATVKGRRILSREGRAYKEEIGYIVLANRKSAPRDLGSKFLRIDMMFWFQYLLKRDIDGGIKILQDAICKALGVNDNRVIVLHVEKREDRTNPRVEVSLEVMQ